MPTQVQFRRGTTGQNNTFTGAEGELTIDTTTWGIRVHDGTTAGGHSLSAGNSNNISGGAAGAIPYQIATSSTGFISIGAADTVLTSDGSTATWVSLGTLTAAGGVNADNLLVNSITSGDRYLVVTDQTGAYTGLEASTLTIYNSTVGLTVKNTTTIGGHLLPETNGIYDLGSSSKRWRTLYITSSTIDIAGSTLTADGSTLYFNGLKVMTGTPSGNLTVTNLVVSGDLTVSGTSTFVNSTVTNVSDPIFGIGGGLNGAAPASDDNKDRGIAFQYHDGSSAKKGFFGFDDSTGYFTFVPDATITNEVVSGSQGDFQASNFRGNLVGNVTGDLTGVASTATNLAGGAAGGIPYQSAAGATTFLSIGTNGFVLTSNGSAPTWQAISGLSAGSATTATNLAGGSVGQIPIQSASGTTAFIPVGTSGQFLQAGTNTATFVSTSSMYVNSAVNAEKIFGGTAGQLVYQSGAGTTAFAGPGTAGQILVSAGTSAPTYTNTGSIYVGTAVNAEKWLTPRTFTFGGDLTGSMVVDGSQNVTFTATIASDSVALGTDTTGNYVAAGATSGFGLSGSASSEGATFTVTANSTSANTVSTIVFRDGNGDFSARTLTLTGDLVVQGTTVTVNSTVTNVSDPIMTIGSGPAGAAPSTDDNKDRGIAFQWHNGSAAKVGFFGYDDSTGYLTFVPDATITNEVVSGAQGDIQATNFRGALVGNADTATSAGKWTTARTFTFGGDLTGSMVVDGSQNVTFTATIAANSVALGTDTTGDYVSNGATSGFGLSGSTTGETQTFTVTANSTSANTVSTIVYRDASGNFSAGIITATNASITAVTSATTTQTGALIVTGGLGVGNNIVAGGALFVGTPTGTVGAVGEIRATNEITAYYSSDQNLKENIQLISDPIEKLNQIRGVYFDWKDSFIDYRGGEDGYFVRKHDVGVIAQEVAKVLPEVVAHKSDGYMGVKYEKIIPLLIEAIKDQQRQITQLSEQVNKLVNK